MYCTQNAKILLWCDIEHVRTLLLLLFYFNIIGVHCYHGVNFFLMGTPLLTQYTLKAPIVSLMKYIHDAIDTLIWDCFLEESTHVMQIMLSGDIISCV